MNRDEHPRLRVAERDTACPADPRAFNLAKAAYSVGESLDVLSIGRTKLYELVNLDELHPVKVGKKTLFLAPDLAAFLARLKQARPGGKAAPDALTPAYPA
jgi:hypothetical protein